MEKRNELGLETDPLCPRGSLPKGKAEESGSTFCNPVKFVQDLSDKFGYKLIFLLFVVQHVRKGFCESFAGAAVPYLFESYSVPAPTAQIYSSVISLPWAMKPVVGLASDVFPIWGYRKAPYFLITSAASAAALFIVGTVAQDTISVQVIVVCLFFASLQVSTCDLLSEAKYAEKIQANKAHGPDLLTYVWFGMTVGGLLASGLSGTVIEKFGPKVPFLLCAFPAAAVCFPVIWGYLEETPLNGEALQRVRERFYRQKEMCMLCFIMLAGTLSLIVCGLMFKDPRLNGLVAIGVAIVVIVSFSVILSPTIAKFNAYAVIQGSLSLSISGATFYFYTDSREQYPEGPHFTPFFYNTVMGVMGGLFSLLGIYCYSRFMSGWNYRHLLVMSNVIYSVLSAIDIVMFTRANVRWGIPDHFFMLSSGVLESIVGQWMWMPQVVILSYLCPKGMEATMYALLAGCANLGNNIAANVGAWLLQELDCRPSGAIGESDQFANLWKAAAIATVLPSLTIFLIFWLVPDARQGEEVIGADVEGDATPGSLWRSWTDA